MAFGLMHLHCFAIAGSLPVGKYGSNTARAQLSSTTPMITLTLNQVLPNDHFSARNHKQLFSRPSPSKQHPHPGHTLLDTISFQVFCTSICFMVLTWHPSWLQRDLATMALSCANVSVGQHHGVDKYQMRWSNRFPAAQSPQRPHS